MTVAERRVQGLHMGVNRQFFQYNTLAGDVVQNADGVVGAPEVISQISAPAQVGEYLNSALLKFNYIKLHLAVV